MWNCVHQLCQQLRNDLKKKKDLLAALASACRVETKKSCAQKMKRCFQYDVNTQLCILLWDGLLWYRAYDHQEYSKYIEKNTAKMCRLCIRR